MLSTKFLVGLSAGLLAAVIGCERGNSSAPKAREREAVEVQVSPVVRRTIERSIDITGTLYGEEEATISAKVGGRVARLAVDVGDEAPSGSELALIDQTDYELALAERRNAMLASLAKLGITSMPDESFDLSKVPTVERSKAEEANAKARLARARQLFEQSPPLISEQDFADIQTQSEVAARSAEVELLTAQAVLAEARTQAAMLAAAQQRLEDTLLRAPSPPGRSVRYRVAQRLVSVGELVAEGQALFRLVASDLIKFRGSVPERYMGRVQPGQRAALRVEAFSSSFEGKVVRVAPQIDARTRSFEVEIEIANPDGRLKPGAFGRASVVVSQEEGVTFVPGSAVVTFAGVQKVFSVDNGKAVEHRVQTGVQDAGMIEIVGGVKADEVVTSGAATLVNGAPVRMTSMVGQP
jgi:RND family efflux transporter MFP subunit